MAKIILDAGHGLYTPGKRCLKSLDPKETREWVLNDRVADAVATYLKSAGHTVMRVDDTTGKTDISLANRVKRANASGYDAYVSIHHNAGINGGSGGGTVVYACKGCQEASTKLRDAIYKHSINRGNLKGNRSDGTLNANFYVVKYTKMPATLIEVGFMDSKTDIVKILDPKWSDKIALGIAEGICEVYGGKVKTTAVATSNGTTSATSTAQIYRIRKSWNDVKSQVGAYKILSSAKTACPKGYTVYDWNGKAVYTNGATTSTTTVTKKGYTGTFPSMPPRGYYIKGDGYKTLTGYKTQIKRIQQFLNWAIGAGLAVDGNYGEKTDSAVRTYQKKYGLKVDGSFGKKTLAHAKTLKK